MFKKLLLVALALSGGVTPADAQTYVTGAPVVGGPAVPMRKDINELQAAGGPQWDLYIRALRNMYDVDANNQLSFFQIAGIHGKPFVEWSAGGPSPRRTNGWPGYCPHGENIFLTWHRPFMALFEQRLVAHALNLAQKYPAQYRQQYIQAAQTLRAPYWDWAVSDIPRAVVPMMVKVRIPNGSGLKTIEMKNPLYTYTFPKAALDGQWGEWDDERRTRIFRCPAPDRFPTSADALLDRRPYKQWVYDALTHSTTFDQFASTGSSGASLEQIHNSIHWDAACGGQFLDAEFSAFDPIFMLHHVNVDRLWAYWQAIRPNEASFTETYTGDSRFSTPRGTRIGPNSPLQPFYRSQGVFHTSESVKNIRSFGYTYQGLEYWRMSQSQMASEARRLINRVYGSGTSRRRDIEDRQAQEKTTRFFAKVQLDVTEVERPCSVDLYIAGRRIGGLVVMQQPDTGTIHGEFSVDDAANTPELLDNCAPEGVADTINNGIEVEIVKHNGEKIPIADVPSLKVSLEDVPYTSPATDDQLPKYGKPRRRPTDIEQNNKKPLRTLNRCSRKLPSFNKPDGGDDDES